LPAEVAKWWPSSLQDAERQRRAMPRATSAGWGLLLRHSPEFAAEMQEARRLGGLRRRRERTVTSAYDIDGFASVAQLQRVLEIVIIDGLGLENSPARGRLLIAAVLAGAKLLEVGELAERLTNVEAALGPRLVARGRRR